MKKSLLALLLTAVFAISGCEDKATTQKLLETEKRLVQLEADFKKAQAELEKKSEELGSLKPAYEKLQQTFPALQVEIATFFDKSETLKFEKDPNDEFAREESMLGLFVSLPKTHIEWLDLLLQEQAFRLMVTQNPQESKAFSQALFEEKLGQKYQEIRSLAKEEKPAVLSEDLSSDYLGQRNHIITFRMLYNAYSGGAHGMYANTYLNINTKTKNLITLNDLVDVKDQSRIKQILWQNYRHSRLNEKGEYEGFVDPKDFRVPDNFYFSQAGIHFVYPVYELGPYVEGEIEVLVGWTEVNNLLTPDYQRTKKDGFYDDSDF